MKKRSIVFPLLLLLTLIGAFFTAPFWEEHLLGRKTVVDGALRSATIDTLVTRLNAHYVFPDKAREVEAVLRRRQREGRYDGIQDGAQLANQLTADMRGAAHDLHMKVRFSAWPLPPDGAAGPGAASQADWDRRANLAASILPNPRVDKADHAGPSIGYLRLSSFPPAGYMAKKYAAAMNALAATDGLIVDMRENGGGDPQSVALLISYFVDRRTRLNDIWNRDTGASTQYWTEATLDGKRYGGKKPIVILAGPRTGSAGEDFTYTMQALKRATVIGRPTWGGAHPVRAYRLGAHFVAMIPGSRSISPITHTNWEGTGVIPDIEAAPDDAFAAATALLRQRL